MLLHTIKVYPSKINLPKKKQFAWKIAEIASDNAKLNNTENISFLHGDIKLIENQDFDIILANINRNIIEKDIEVYYDYLVKNGDLLISGFLEEDIDFIINLSVNNRFNVINKKNKGQWSMVHLRK